MKINNFRGDLTGVADAHARALRLTVAVSQHV